MVVFVVVGVVVATTCVVVGTTTVVVGIACVVVGIGSVGRIVMVVVVRGAVVVLGLGFVVVVVVRRRRVVVVALPVVVVVTVSPGCVVVVDTTVVDVVTDPSGHSSNFRGTHTSLIQSVSVAGTTPSAARAEKRTFSRPGRFPFAATAKSTKSVRIGPLMSRPVGVVTAAAS